MNASTATADAGMSFKMTDLNGAAQASSWSPSDTTKIAFLKLLSLMPNGFASDLKTAIKSGRFHTFLVAPMIGGGGRIEMTGMPNRDGNDMFYAWGGALIKIGEGEHADSMEDGYHWLASLYDKGPPKANRTTVAWLDEWLASQGAKKPRKK